MNNLQRMNIEEFCTNFEYPKNELDSAYKLLANYSILASTYSHETITCDIQDVVYKYEVNGVSFDGFIILLDSRVVTSKKAIEDIFHSNETVNVDIVIIESVLKSKDTDNLTSFIHRIKDAFSVILGDINLHGDDSTCASDDILSFLFEQCVTHHCPSPSLNIYFVADDLDEAAKEEMDEELNSLFSSQEENGSFSQITRHKLNTQELLVLYNHTKIRETAEITPYRQDISLPSMPGVKDALIAVVSFKEFKKLLVNESGQIKTSIFHDNIRAFQGTSAVSRQMTKTLKKGNFDQFIAMNNGITIIVGELNRKSENKLELVDYQIVNGCQTCHVLYNNRKLHGIDNLLLLVKIICSTDENVRTSIIMGTNSQIEVKREQLIALTGVQERIEDYYTKMRTKSGDGCEQLYYERRSKQYVTETKVPQSKVITIPIEIMSFGSIFLSSPHYVAGYYSQIIENLKNKGKEIFTDKYLIDPYYTSGLMYYKLSHLFNTHFIAAKYKKVKYQLLYAARLVAEIDNKELPNLESSEIEDYCAYLNKLFCDDRLCKDCFSRAKAILDYAIQSDFSDSVAQKKEITETVYRYVQEQKKRVQNEGRDEWVMARQKEWEEFLKTPNAFYFETRGYRMAVNSLVSLTERSKQKIVMVLGRALRKENNDDLFIQSISSFLERCGKLEVFTYNKEENLLDSNLMSRLALYKSRGADIVVRRLQNTPRIEYKDQQLKFNLYLFDTESVRIELENAFTVGRIWHNEKDVIAKYQKKIAELSATDLSEEVNLLTLFDF